MLIPAKTKYRKAQKGGKKILGVASNGNSLKFGAYGLKALEPSKLNSKQIDWLVKYKPKKSSFFNRFFS